MKIIVTKDYDELSRISANKFMEAIKRKPDASLGLATGSSPIGLYKELIHLHKKSGLDFSKVKTFNLDEYVGISQDHPESYHRFMFEQLFNHINISPENVHIPRGDQPDIHEQCDLYEKEIQKAGGIDIQVLGIGSNGHIGFNEPGSSPEERTRVVQLADSTIKANARFFGSEELVPRLAISMGIQTILTQSKQIILLASGHEKADAVQAMVEGKITPELPASYLQSHPDVTVIVDQQAAKKLKVTQAS
ncbi:glucosamine-6-phosphate deaminase [Bacillus sp. USDA818B3_A]|uniref:glucosamine-6-phosphate deaminase n=1 Tax=Bacillus sp. USDA818B3_A TaxID=2698834 RepID=UPI00137080AC|nr:glucosamine-6-phosphate deaminase [Bacillus sp. USDA818B3_A]